MMCDGFSNKLLKSPADFFGLFLVAEFWTFLDTHTGWMGDAPNNQIDM
jgi:hypothetical protein